MGVFEMVVILVFIGTAGKVAQSYFSRPSHRGSDAAESRLQALEAEVRTGELRLSQVEERAAELTEKLRFMEDLLAAPRPDARLAPSPGQTPSGSASEPPTAFPEQPTPRT